MLAALRRNYRRRIRDELDREPEDPWSLLFGPHFSNPMFKPARVSQLGGGITADEIRAIDPGDLISQRSAAVLKKKWCEARFLYTAGYENIQQSGQNHESRFNHYA